MPLAAIGMFVSTRELPGYAVDKHGPFSVHLLRAGAQIGLIESTATYSDWTFFREGFRVGKAMGQGFFKWADVTGTPGPYSVGFHAAGSNSPEESAHPGFLARPNSVDSKSGD